MSVASPARRAAFEVLRRTFEHGAWTDRAFPAAAARHELQGRERAQAQRLAYGSVQRRGTSDEIVARLTGRPAERLDPPVAAALRLGLFELLFSATPAHAAVSEAVALARQGMRRGGERRARAAAGLVNAVLRRAGRERQELLGALRDDEPGAAAVAHSVPLWIAELWWRELGPADARRLLRSVNEPPETALRVSVLRTRPDSLAAELRAAGEPLVRREGPALLWPAEAFVAPEGLGPRALRALERGELTAQSRGAQAVVELLDPRPGERILDLCAGPGLKTSAIAGRMRGGGEIVAVESDPARAAQIEELCARTGAANARVVVADAARADVGEGYDRVLVDPPCSDLGTLASRPDARWRKQPETVARVRAVQAAALARGLAALRPGGALVYSTCTISRAEGEGVVREVTGGSDATIDELGAEHPGLASSHDARCLQVRPDRDGTDGFFLARLRRPA